MNQQEIDELFAQTVSGDYEDDAPWEAVRELHRIGTREVFDQAARWCHSENPLLRARGVDVIAQLGKTVEHPSNSLPDESYRVVSALIECEKDPLPLKSAIAALGHIGDAAAVPLLVRYVNHPNAKVRFDLAFSLGCFPDVPEAIDAFLVLMQDSDADVRDWSTFGLGVLGKSDSAEIRDALFLRVSDSDQDTREEAIVGLSKRKDHRVVKPLIEMLEQQEVPSRAIEAAVLVLGTTDEEELSGRQYATALRQKFPLQV